MSKHVHAGRACRRVAAVALVFAVAVTITGCGVSSSSSPTDVGDGLVSGTSRGSDIVRAVPDPNSVSTAEDLVRSYLKAAVGGGEAASSQVRAFLTDKAKRVWREPTNPKNPQLTVVRLVEPPNTGPSTVDRTPVTVHYQVVGALSDQGRVDELSDLVTRTMTFWVKPAEQSRLRVDEIVGAPAGQLLISDDALTDLYRPQPVYFWDSDNGRLVPDVRYLPLTVTPELRAQKMLQWLLDGPSPWLTGAQRLPTGTVRKGPVIYRDGAFVVNLSAQAGAGGPDAIRHLYYQLRWTLRTETVPAVVLQIEDQTAEIPGTSDEYLQYNLSNDLAPVGQKFDIVDRHVVPLGTGATLPAVLEVKENQNVLFAAVNRRMDMAAFVHADSSGRRSLSVVRDGKAGRVLAKIPASFNIGRPVWVPGSNDQLIVPSNGRLYAVAAGGSSNVLTSSQLGDVAKVAIAPDGRRIAFVASGQAYVASLKFDGTNLTIGSNPRPVLAGQLNARAIAWESESWLYVAGTSGTGPALWRATADSVVAENLSAKLRGVTPAELVAYPTNPASRPVELYVLTDQPGAYRFVNVTSLGPLEPGIKAPFFAG